MKKLGFLTLALAGLMFVSCEPTVEEGDDVAVTGLTMNKTAVELDIEDVERLSVVKTPSNATTAVTWASSDPAVASVSANGTVTALEVGTATITASADGHDATCVVTVLEPVSIKFTQGEIFGYVDDLYETGTEISQYIQVYLYTDDVDVAGFSGDGFGMRLPMFVPYGTGASIPAGTYTFTDFTTATDAVPNTVESGYSYKDENDQNQTGGSWLIFFVESDPELLELGWEPGAYSWDPNLAGASFEVSVEDGVYTFAGEFINPAYDEAGAPIEGESGTFTFRFKGELPDNTPAGAPAAVRSLNTLNSKVRIPWLKK